MQSLFIQLSDVKTLNIHKGSFFVIIIENIYIYIKNVIYYSLQPSKCGIYIFKLSYQTKNNNNKKTIFTTVKSFQVRYCFYTFERLLVVAKVAFIWSKVQKKSNVVKYYN